MRFEDVIEAAVPIAYTSAVGVAGADATAGVDNGSITATGSGAAASGMTEGFERACSLLGMLWFTNGDWNALGCTDGRLFSFWTESTPGGPIERGLVLRVAARPSIICLCAAFVKPRRCSNCH